MRKSIHFLIYTGIQAVCLFLTTACDPNPPVFSKNDDPQRASPNEQPDDLDKARFHKERWAYKYRGLGKITGENIVLYTNKEDKSDQKKPAPQTQPLSSASHANSTIPAQANLDTMQKLEHPLVSRLGAQFSSDLWQGALKALASFPLEIMDGENGVLQTSVFTLPKKPNERFQMRVQLYPGETSYSNVQCNIIHHVLEKGQWVLKGASASFERELKRDILLHARSCAVKNRKLISSS